MEVVEECMRTKTAVEVMEAQVAVPDLKVRGNVDYFSSHGPVLPKVTKLDQETWLVPDPIG